MRDRECPAASYGKGRTGNTYSYILCPPPGSKRTSGMQGMAGGPPLPDLLPVISDPSVPETGRTCSLISRAIPENRLLPKKGCDQAFPK